jgi:Cu/Ag efflux pump CusA
MQQVEAQLPANAAAPEISPLVSPLGTILQYAFTVEPGGTTSLMDLHQLVLRSYRNPILAVPGVTQITVYGGEEAQHQVLLDPQELQVKGVSLKAVMQGVSAAMSTSPPATSIAVISAPLHAASIITALAPTVASTSIAATVTTVAATVATTTKPATLTTSGWFHTVYRRQGRGIDTPAPPSDALDSGGASGSRAGESRQWPLIDSD